MKDLRTYINESKAVDMEVSDLMDEVADYFTLDLKEKNPFKRAHLDRAGWVNNVPFGDKKLPALKWEHSSDPGKPQVIMMFDGEENGLYVKIYLLSIKNADQYLRHFTECPGSIEFTVNLKRWKTDMRKHCEKFCKNYTNEKS